MSSIKGGAQAGSHDDIVYEVVLSLALDSFLLVAQDELMAFSFVSFCLLLSQGDRQPLSRAFTAGTEQDKSSSLNSISASSDSTDAFVFVFIDFLFLFFSCGRHPLSGKNEMKQCS